MLSAAEIERRRANTEGTLPVGDHAFEDLTDLQNDEFIVSSCILYPYRTLSSLTIVRLLILAFIRVRFRGV